MADFAELGISIQSRAVLRAQDELRSLASTGGATERALTSQTGRIGRDMSRLPTAARAAAGGLVRLNNSATAAAGGIAVVGQAIDAVSDAGENAQRTTGRVTSVMAASWRRLAGVIGTAGAAIAAAFSIGAVINTIASFDASMAQVQAVTRATADEMTQLRAVAQDLGATTEFSASQAADGLRFLGMAGFSANESIAAIPAVLDLATASSIGLAGAADIASNVLSGFGMEAGDAAAVADVLAAAASRSNTSVSQLGQAMSTVAPVSASLGIGLADTAAAIGLMSDAGVQGERAGTALRGVLASLAGPTTQAAEALAALGLSVQDVNPEVHSMEVIFGRLRAAGMTTADAMTIFGREAATGAIILAEGSQRLGEFGRELGNVGGAAAEMAGIMRDTLQGDLNTLKSAVEGLILAMGDAGLTAVIRAVVQAISFMVSAVSASVSAVSGAVLAFGEAIGGFEGYFIAASMAVATYFLPSIISAAAGLTATLVPAIWGAITATGAWVASLVTLRGALILTGIGAFVVAAGFAINFLLQLRERTGGWAEALTLLGEVAGGVWSGITTSAEAIPPALAMVWNRIAQGFYTMTAGIARAWADLISGLTTLDLGGIETPFGNIDFGSMRVPGVEEAVGSIRSFADEMARSAGDAGTAALNAQGEAAGRVAAGFDEASAALARLRSAMQDAGTETVDTNAAIAAINDALAATGTASGAAADGVDRVSESAKQAEESLQTIAGNMSRFFMQVMQGSDAARAAIGQLLSRAAEMLMNNALMSLLQGTMGKGSGGGLFGGILNLLFNANGGVYSSPSLSAYSGQVVSNPTLFAFASGAGVMGEAGPEAILPLKRGPDGKLGVSASGSISTNPSSSMDVNITVSVDQNGNLQAFVDKRVAGGVTQGLDQFNRALPGRVAQIQRDPRAR